MPVLANFIGISGALLVPSSEPAVAYQGEEIVESKRHSKWLSHHKRFALIATFEVLGNVLGVLGLIFAGSGLFQVVYASVVIFTALFSKTFLGRNPQPKQWLCLFLITLGLAISAFGNSSSLNSDTTASNSDTTRETFIGMTLTLFCAILYASSYVGVEFTLSEPEAPSERNIQAFTGLYGLTIISVYILVHTIPNWNTLVLANIEAKKGSLSWVFIAYALLSLSSFLHGISYYKLVGSVGSVSTGVLQSLRAISVFAISSLAFCGSHAEQCVTNAKILSMIIVCAGLTGYSAYAAPKRINEEKNDSKL